MSMEQDPNVMIVFNDQEEAPEQMMLDYYDSIMYAIKKGQYDEIYHLLGSFFTEANIWTARQTLIDQSKANLAELEELTHVQTLLKEGDFDALEDNYYDDEDEEY